MTEIDGEIGLDMNISTIMLSQKADIDAICAQYSLQDV